MLNDYKNTPYIEENAVLKRIIKIAVPIGIFF